MGLYILFAFIPSINASTTRFSNKRLNEFAVVYKDNPLKYYNLMSQMIRARKMWIWSNLIKYAGSRDRIFSEFSSALINRRESMPYKFKPSSELFTLYNNKTVSLCTCRNRYTRIGHYARIKHPRTFNSNKCSNNCKTSDHCEVTQHRC